MLPQGFRTSSPETAEILPGGGLFWGGVILSLLCHILVLLLLLWHPDFEQKEQEPPPPPPVEMVYEEQPKAESLKASKSADVPLPPAPTEVKAPPSPEPPKPHEVIAPPPPSPPPPIHAKAVPQVMHHAAPKEEKPQPQSKPKEETHDVLKSPLKMALSEKGSLAQSDQPKKKPVKETHKEEKTVKTPTHPPTTKSEHADKEDKNPEQKTASQQASSHTTQSHEMPKTQEDSHSLLSTLESFRSEQKQDHPSSAKANPAQGGSPHGGGNPDGDTRALTAAQQKEIGTSVRRCYQEDTAAKNYASFVAHLIVTVDGTGVARLVSFAPETASKMQSDASYRALAERARDAVLSPSCAHLPIPAKLLGKTRQLRFVFRP